MMLFLPLSAFIWKLKPPGTVQGILGENLTLEWKFSLANENFDYFLLLRSGDDMIKYSNDGSVIIYSDFIGLVGMATNGTPAFTLLNLQLIDDKAKFCCKVGTKSTGASGGNVHKDCVTLKLLVRPSITAISGNITLNESDDVILSCNATGTPPPNITWSKSGDQHKNIKLGSLLPLRNISRAQDGLYWCTAENGAGKSIASVRVIVQFPPSIVYISHDTLANEADDVKLFCNSTGNPRPNITWTFLNGSNSKIIQSEKTLVLSNVTRNQAGTYKCTADNGIMVPSIANVQVAINFPPFIEYISSDTNVNETDDVMLSCNSTGNPRPNITWSFQRGLQASNIKTGETLFLSDVRRDQAGAYGCTADNGVMSSKTVYVHITVNYEPEIKDGVRKKITSWINHETKMTCEAEGVPAPDIIWTRNDITISPSKSKTGVREIMIKPKDVNDFGDYMCTAKNLLGSTQQIITIEEIVAPEAPEILRIDTGVDNMEIHWQASISSPEFPVLDYLVRVEEKDELNWRKNCTRFQTKGSSQMCAVNELRSGTVYIVQIAARNVVGYSPFTKTEAQTKNEAGKTDAQIQKQQQLSEDAIDGIIGGVICFCSLVVVIVAIVTQRRPCNRGCNKTNVNKGLEGCINGGIDVAIEESPQTAELEERV